MYCNECNKCLKLVEEYPCKCELYFCKTHKFRDNHNCTFNYKNKWKEYLKESNPVTTSSKVNMI